jgi:hypothetical protein
LGGEALRDTVGRQADARVRGDDAAFASYMTPQALLQLSGNGLGGPMLPRARMYNILDITDQGSSAESSVRYVGAGSYVIRTRWRLIDGVWKGVEAEVPQDSMRAPWWRRLLRQGPRPAPPVERRDLS